MYFVSILGSFYDQVYDIKTIVDLAGLTMYMQFRKQLVYGIFFIIKVCLVNNSFR